MKAFTRVFTLTALLAGASLVTWWWFTTDQVRTLERELASMKAEMATRLAERDAMIARLQRDHRIGRIEVLGQSEDAGGDIVETKVRFIELNDDGREIGRMEASLPGSVLFVDALTIRFDPQFVAEGDPLRGRTLVLLRRLYSDRMRPVDGIAIDTPGAVPHGYAGSERARYEQVLWTRFWTIATDAAAAREAGVRVAQGEAAYQPMRTGQVFDLRVEAVGGITLVIADDTVYES